MVKYTFFWVSSKENDKVYQIVIELPHLVTVFEAVREVIPYFNQRLAEDGSQYTLSGDANLYDLYKAKKSGHAKMDYPGNFQDIFS
jgi:hypothetical protein